MRLSGINGAKEELEDSKRFLLEMERAQNLDQLKREWKHFLLATNRVYNRLSSACKGDTFDIEWIELKRAFRVNDPLLNYIYKARDCAEHSLGPPTDTIPASMTMNLVGPGRFDGFISSFGPEGLGKGSHFQFAPATLGSSLRLNFNSPSVRLLDAVDDRFPKNPSNSVPVPTEHLGRRITNVNPISIARLAIDYFDGLICEAENRLP